MSFASHKIAVAQSVYTISFVSIVHLPTAPNTFIRTNHLPLLLSVCELRSLIGVNYYANTWNNYTQWYKPSYTCSPLASRMSTVHHRFIEHTRLADGYSTMSHSHSSIRFNLRDALNTTDLALNPFELLLNTVIAVAAIFRWHFLSIETSAFICLMPSHILNSFCPYSAPKLSTGPKNFGNCIQRPEFPNSSFALEYSLIRIIRKISFPTIVLVDLVQPQRGFLGH